jgi:quinoprotein glucose dehydrogenase
MRIAPLLALTALANIAGAQAGSEWPAWGGDLAATKYSTLTDINRGNVAQLSKAWEWATNETPNTAPRTRPGNFQATPLMIGDTLYLSTSYNRVVALDASTGREFWSYDPKAYLAGQPPNGTGFVHRGIATWSDGRRRRIFMNSRWNLIALDAATGNPIRDFGDTGVVDLTKDLARNGKPVNKLHYTQTSPPVVWRNLVIVGNGVADKLIYPNDPPGDVQAFDVKSGKRVWSFSPVPRRADDDGAETWQDNSWKTTGHTNVWAPFSVDDRRGLVYLPVSTPSNDWYGGARKGNDLYAESIVCLDARNGHRVWHFQTVHHGLWDYDLPAAPVLGTVTVGRDRKDIVAVPTKTGLLFVFDRTNGHPIWPIAERSVPASDVPGEAASQSQPFPSLPAPFAKQGFSFNDLIDFTPAIKARALETIKDYRVGPIFTPPSIGGTIVMPGAIGGAGWGGGAFDPMTGTIYIKVTNQPALYKIIQPTRSDSLDADYTADLAAQSLRAAAADQQAAVWDARRDRSQHRRHEVERHARRHARHSQSSAVKELECAAGRRRRSARADRHRGRFDLRHRRRRDALRDRPRDRRNTVVGWPRPKCLCGADDVSNEGGQAVRRDRDRRRDRREVGGVRRRRVRPRTAAPETNHALHRNTCH